MEKLVIRDAVFEDVPFVAECVLAAVDLYDFAEPSIEKEVAELVCSQEDTLYSYRHARVAELDGRPVGCLVSYDGALYASQRRTTFAYFEAAGRLIPPTESETEAGEYYLDSMAIRPEARGHEIGLRLLQDAIDSARMDGFSRAALIVELSKPHLRAYYARLGFLPLREMDAFGDRYLKMVLDL